jgi:hypothetical protein
MLHWNPWFLVPITIFIFLLCALLGWILRLVEKQRAGAKSDWQTIGKIAITIVCGGGMAFAGCFGLISPINRGNDYESLFLAVAFGGLIFFVAGIIWGTALGLRYLVLARRKNANKS